MRYLIAGLLLLFVLRVQSLPEPPGTGVGEEVNYTFKEDIFPFFQEKCNSDNCHGKKGEAFPKYLTYAMIKAKAKKIVKRLKDTRDPMPPKDSGVRVTGAEIAMLEAWIKAGYP